MAEQKLTLEQMERVKIVIHGLARRGNAWGIGIERQIAGKSAEEQRRVILGSVGQMYEVLLALRMATDSERSAAEIEASLQASGRRT